MPAQIVYQNLADDGAITASSWLASAPPSRLQNHHTTRRWQGRSGDTESILLTWSAAQTIDCIALFKCAGVFGDELAPLTSAATTRIRVSSVDLTGLAGDLYDSGTASGRIDASEAALIVLLEAPVSAVAVLIDISQATASALLAGRMVAGLREEFTFNFGYGWSSGYVDQSRKSKSAAGLTFIERDERYKVLSLQFDSLDEADRVGFVREIERLNGTSEDVFLIRDPASTNIARDSIWGLIQNMNPASQPNFAFYSKSLEFEERL
jgi:hypothetical protein